MKIKNYLKLFIGIFISSLALFSAFAVNTDFTDVRVSLINQNPTQVVAGDIVEVRVGVENLGYDTANDVIIRALSEYPFEVITDKEISVGTIQSSTEDGVNMQIVKFKLKVSSDITAGSYDFNLEYYENGNSNLIKEATLLIDVKNKESAEITAIDKIQILPGKKEKITFTIENTGSSVLRDLIFSWENIDGVILPVGIDNSMYIKEIEVGKSVNVSFDIIASSFADADLYKLDLKLSYENSISNLVDVAQTTAGLYVGGNTDFDVVFSDESSGEISFTISNIGAVDAKSVTISIPEQDKVSLFGSNSQIIGNLNNGDYTATSFKVSSQKDTILLNIDYTNNLGERISVVKEVKVKISQSLDNIEEVKKGDGSKSSSFGPLSSKTSDNSSPLTNIGILFVVLVLSFISYKIYKKVKRNKR